MHALADRSGQSTEAVGKKIPAEEQEYTLFSTEHSALSTGLSPSAHPLLSPRRPHDES
jgi:hypothetical protein